jgi:hypothetical protein
MSLPSGIGTEHVALSISGFHLDARRRQVCCKPLPTIRHAKGDGIAFPVVSLGAKVELDFGPSV